jgi:hypothetical protein
LNSGRHRQQFAANARQSPPRSAVRAISCCSKGYLGKGLPQRIAFAHERKVIGTLLLNLLFAMFKHNEAHLKRHFGASLETMTVGIAVLLLN